MSATTSFKQFKFVKEGSYKDELVKIIQDAYDNTKRDEKFYVGLSGGSMPKLLVECFRRLDNIDWKRWILFFCDERLVPSASEESTFGTYKRLLQPLDTRLPLSLDQFVTVDPSLSGTKAADDYLSKLRQRFDGADARFNILFLGIGPDGHTCSLFPNHKLLKEQTRWVAYIGDSPKPPPERVTLTLPLMEKAKMCLFLVTGSGKAEIVKDIVEKNTQCPANLVAPQNGKLIWLIDENAGSLVKPELRH